MVEPDHQQAVFGRKVKWVVESSMHRLLQLRADQNIATSGVNYYLTALMIACIKGRIEVVRTLLTTEADVNRTMNMANSNNPPYDDMFPICDGLTAIIVSQS